MTDALHLGSKARDKYEAFKYEWDKAFHNKSALELLKELRARAKRKKWPFSRKKRTADSERQRDREPICRLEVDAEQTQTQGSHYAGSDRNAATRFEYPRPAPHPPSSHDILTLDNDEDLPYERIRELGRGASGTVYHCVFPATGAERPVKIVDIDMILGMCHTPNDWKILRERLHDENRPNIVKLGRLYFVRATAEAHIVMQYCAGGSVAGMVERYEELRNPIPTAFLKHFISSMAAALGFLHEGLRLDGSRRLAHQPVVHRNIRLANILFRRYPKSAQDLPGIVLADFGDAAPSSDSLRTSGEAGTAAYSGPSQIAPSHIAPAADVHALGKCIVKLLICGKVGAARELPTAHMTSGLEGSAFTYQLLQRCLNDDTQRRPSAKELFAVGTSLRARLEKGKR